MLPLWPLVSYALVPMVPGCLCKLWPLEALCGPRKSLPQRNPYLGIFQKIVERSGFGVDEGLGPIFEDALRNGKSHLRGTYILIDISEVDQNVHFRKIGKSSSL